MRGRRPKPTHLKIIEGNAGRRPLNVDEPEPKQDLTSDAPTWMTERQKEIYTAARTAAPDGLLADLDESVFCRWVVSYEEYQRMNDQVAKYGDWVKGPGGKGMVANPAKAQRSKVGKEMQHAAVELGFTPSARSRVKIDPNAAKKSNPFTDLKTFGKEG